MNVLEGFIENREEGKSTKMEADDLWLRERSGIDPAERRASWQRWLMKTLDSMLTWPVKSEVKGRLIGQCACELTVLAQQLRGRGWLLEGKALAEHVRALLTPIAAAQKAGTIREFWPYFGEAVTRYVGANAEEIQRHAKRTGADEGVTSMAGAMAAFGFGAPVDARGASMTEIVATRSAELADARRTKQLADKAQMKLL